MFWYPSLKSPVVSVSHSTFRRYLIRHAKTVSSMLHTCMTAIHSPQTTQNKHIVHVSFLYKLTNNFAHFSITTDHDESIQICRRYLCAHWISHQLSFLNGYPRSIHAPFLPRLIHFKRSFCEPVGTCPICYHFLIFIETLLPVAVKINRGIFNAQRKWIYWSILLLPRQIRCFGFDYSRSSKHSSDTIVFGM